VAPWEQPHGETPIDPSGLRKRGSIRNRRELSTAEALNINRAFRKYLASKPSSRSARFDHEWSLKLHREMFGDVWTWAGVVRTRDLNLGVPHFQVTEQISALVGDLPRKRVEDALAGLSRRLEGAGLPFELRAIAGGWQLFTTPDMAETVGGLARARRDEKISPAALETLAVVAYRQPVTKAEIESIRGVQVGPILRALVDRGLVRVAGRSDDPGHPLLYATTRQFLDAFGLASLDDLPRDGELVRD